MKPGIKLLMSIAFISLFSCNSIIQEGQARIQNEKGVAYLNEGKTELAIEEFQSALDIASSIETKTQLLRNLAITYYDMGELIPSRQYSLMAATLNPENSISYLVNMADVNLIDGDVNEAILKLEKSIEKGGAGLETSNSLGLIYYGEYGLEFQNMEKAIFYNKKAYEISRDRATQDLLARTYYEAADYENAELHFRSLESEFPHMLDYSYYLGLIKYETGSVDEAREILNEVIVQDSLYLYGIEYIFE